MFLRVSLKRNINATGPHEFLAAAWIAANVDNDGLAVLRIRSELL